jgi:hypothetical protein
LTGENAGLFTDFAVSETNGFTTKINTTTAGVYKLQLQVKNSNILSNVVNISINTPTLSQNALVISTSNVYHYTGTVFTIEAQYTAYNYTPEVSNLVLDASSSNNFSRISADAGKITVQLPDNATNGTYHFAIKDSVTNVVSNTISVVLLESNSSTQFISIENGDNSIIAFNEEHTIGVQAYYAGITTNEITIGKEVNTTVFTNFTFAYNIAMFTILATTTPGSYKFYLQRKDDDNFKSNIITFVIGDFG